MSLSARPSSDDDTALSIREDLFPPAPSLKRQKTSANDAGVIDLTGPDLPVFKPSVNSDDDEVEIVDPPPPKASPVKTAGCASDADDVELVGTVNEVKLPHMRPHCTEHPFESGEDTVSNSRVCDLCYCYVCDVPANKDCKEWLSHCNATDKGQRAYHWKSLRRSQQNSHVTFEATMRDGKLLKRLFQTMKKFVKKITLECETYTGIHCRAMDAKGRAGVSLNLERRAFTHYSCKGKVRLSVNVVDVTRALKGLKGKYSGVNLRATSSVLTITVQNGPTGVALSDPVHISLLHDQEDGHFDEPREGYTSLKCTMHTTKFKRVVESYHKQNRNTRMVLPANDDRRSLLFRVPISSHMGEQRTRVMESVGGVVANQRTSEAEVQFTTPILFQFTRSRPFFSHNVSLFFSSSNQMKVEYELEESYGYVALHMSPLSTIH